ncbi:MAG TPA: hypothetical protein VGI87_14100 [Solirubrobacteraceae bacterium]|jgi:hypothetical protein
MAGDEQRNPSEQRGGTPPGEDEAREKGPWAAKAGEGVVPAELGGSDGSDEMLPEDPELGSSVLGGSAATEEPATDAGIDRTAGDEADATSDAGVERPDAAEPDLKDAAAGPRLLDADSAQ